MTTFSAYYVDRLRNCGIHEDDAVVIVNDFLRDLDFDGLCAYCAELERLHELAKV